MGQFGRLTTLKDLPTRKALTAYLKKAMALNIEAVKTPPPAKPKVAHELTIPAYLSAALDAKPGAGDHFNGFSTSAKREYVDWLTEAKTEATRLRRLEQAVDWIAEGKQRNWKYKNC